MAHGHLYQSSSTSAVANYDPAQNPSASSPVRPTSSYTLDSTFADSAVDMDATTPTDLSEPYSRKVTEYFEPTLPLTSGEVDNTLSDKMRQLTAAAWALEQDDSMPATKRQSLHRRLQDLGTHLELGPQEEVEVAPAGDHVAIRDLSQPEKDDTVVDAHVKPVVENEDDEWIDESELIAVHENLAATVRSMRLRQEEQRHLHQLTLQKLEAVAQRCISQEQQAQELLREVHNLRLQNHNLEAENDQLRGKVANLEVDASRNEVAVEAMSSAVTGLEGWIETTHPSRVQTPIPRESVKRQRVVIRGKGRFRGRYHVNEDEDEAVAHSLPDAATESQELHDGVKAWLRGFRDVEEELRQHESPGSSTRSRPQGRFRILEHREDDDWGEFQSSDARDRH